jgi:hypothetical protein
MANKRHKPEEIVTKLRQVKVLVGLHGRTELPGDDVAGIIVEDGRQIEPAPTDDLEVSEVGLPELVRRCGFVSELVCRLDDDKGRAGDQVLGLEKPIDRGFRDEVTLGIREPDGQFPWANTILQKESLVRPAS